MNDPVSPWASATEIAGAVAGGATTATAVAHAALARVAALNPGLNAYTDITAERALREAAAVDAGRDAGRPPGPLAGVPFAVKNLFDVAGLPTRAGSKINRDRPPAAADAALVRRLNAAGAVLLGTLNMGEYAYDFTGANVHDGACRNPHDPERISGGSSSGSGAATAAGMAPVSLGSDTNGSLRVPASLCGVFSLKPTYGRLGRGGTFPFVDSLDHLGPFARSAEDLALAYDALQGPDPGRSRLCAPCRRAGHARAFRRRPRPAGRRARRLVPRQRPRGRPRQRDRRGGGSGRGRRDRQRPPRRRRGGPRRRLPDHGLRERGLPPRAAAPPGRGFRSRESATASWPARCCPPPGSAAPSVSAAGGSGRRWPPCAASICCWRRPRPVRRPAAARSCWTSAAAACRCARAWGCWRSPSPASACRWRPFRSSPPALRRSGCRSSPRPGARTCACGRPAFSKPATWRWRTGRRSKFSEPRAGAAASADRFALHQRGASGAPRGPFARSARQYPDAISRRQCDTGSG